MSRTLVVFEKRETDNYAAVIESIKSISNFARITDNCYIFETGLSVVQLRDMLSSAITGKIFAMQFYEDDISWACDHLSSDVVEWLKRK